MSHEIFGERIALRNAPAWHGLGKVFTEALSASEALKLADCDYDVAKVPLFVTYPPGETDPAKIKVLDTKHVGLVRLPTADSPEGVVLGVASHDYELVQNREIARMLDPLTNEWPVETLGALKSGGILFATLDMGEFSVAGDKCRQYLLLSNGHDGTRSLTGYLTGVRVVCWNTLVMSEGQNAMAFRLRHVGGVKREAEFYINLIAGVRSAAKQAQGQLARLGEAKVTTEQAQQVIAAAYPVPPEPEAQKRLQAMAQNLSASQVASVLARTEELRARRAADIERATTLQTAGLELFEKFNAEHPDLAHTAWAAYNAVTELATWREGPNADAAVLFGNRWQEMSRGLAAALTLA